MSTALLLFPDFALILLGLALRRYFALGDHFWSGVEKLVYFILFPALLVHAVSRTQFEYAVAGPLVGAALASMLGAMLLMTPLKPLFGLSSIRAASIFQCGYRFNSYIGLAAAGLLFGTPGLATMGLIIGAAVPLANLTAVSMLARHGEAGILREVLRNPLIWATALGFALNVGGIAIPKPVDMMLERLADASIALGLLTVGAALRLSGSAGMAGAAIWVLVVKLAALPAVAWLIGCWLALPAAQMGVLLIFAALPSASSAYILTMRMGGDGAAVAWLISASTLLSMLTMPLWVALRALA